MIAKRRIPRGYRETEVGLIVPAPRMRGLYKLEAIRPDGRRRPLTGWFDNLITDAGLDAIGTSNAWMIQCRVGTGNAAPANSDTSLQTQVAVNSSQPSTDLTNSGASEYYSSRTNVYRFDAGQATGNIAEVGVGISGGGSLFSRALVLDGGGDPTTVTVLADEALDVTYQLRNYPILTDVETTIDISGDDYDVVIRAAEVDDAARWNGGTSGTVGGGHGLNSVFAYSGAIAAVTGTPAGTAVGANATNVAYGTGNYYRDFNVEWGLSSANFGGGGVQAVYAQLGDPLLGAANTGLGAVQIGFTPGIPKDGTKVLALQFRHTWARKAI